MRIVNVHEHIESRRQAPALLDVMDDLGIQRTILLGSPRYTLTLNPQHGYTGIEQNNAELFAIQAEWPDRFEAWPTIDPRRDTYPDVLLHAETQGVKLYLGHGQSCGADPFHLMPLGDARLDNLWGTCESLGLPIMLHLNPDKYLPEFRTVMADWPELRVILPHWVLHAGDTGYLAALLETYPTVRVDVSFGRDDFLIAGLKRISANPNPLRRLLRHFPDRFLWGTDLVITGHPRKDRNWIAVRMQTYLDMLTYDTYDTPLVPGVRLNGLGLPKRLLYGVLAGNYRKFRVSEKRTVFTPLDTSPASFMPMGVRKADSDLADFLGVL